MQIRHSSLLARAQFLQTQSEPKLVCFLHLHSPVTLTDSLTYVQYYKPWELLPGDEAVIKKQIEAAEDIIQREASQFEAENPPETAESSPATTGKPPGNSDLPVNSPETVGSATNKDEQLSSEMHNDTNPDPKSSEMSNKPPKAVEPTEALKDHGDDAGEIVLEGEEDTVIY